MENYPPEDKDNECAFCGHACEKEFCSKDCEKAYLSEN